MSVVWMDDPQFYNTSEVSVRYSTVAASPSVSSGNGRFGNNSLRLSGGTSPIYVLTSIPSAIATGTVAFSFRWSGTNNGSITPIAAVWDGASIQCDLAMNSTGQLLVRRAGTTTLATSTAALSINTWYRIEFQITINNSTGNIEVRVNGTDYIPSTGSLNTRNTSNNQFEQVSWGDSLAVSLSSMIFDYNDLVVTDSNSPNAGFLGDCRVYTRFPNGNSSVAWTPTWASFQNSHAYPLGDQFKDSNGNVQQCTVAGTSQSTGTPTWATTGGSTTTSGGATFTVVGTGSNPGAQNWMAVSEPYTDDDDSYNTSSTSGQTDLFTLPSLPAGAANITAIDNVICARKDDAGTRTIQSEISSSGTTSNGASFNLGSNYEYDDFISQTDPHTSSAWTVSGANALLVGYEEIT